MSHETVKCHVTQLNVNISLTRHHISVERPEFLLLFIFIISISFARLPRHFGISTPHRHLDTPPPSRHPTAISTPHRHLDTPPPSRYKNGETKKKSSTISKNIFSKEVEFFFFMYFFYLR